VSTGGKRVAFWDAGEQCASVTGRCMATIMTTINSRITTTTRIPNTFSQRGVPLLDSRSGLELVLR
jgi:hypothetical protein